LENSGKIKLSERRKRQLLIGLAAVLVILILLFHRPAAYHPVYVRSDNSISTYLTNELLPAIYNGAQRGQPFEAVITQKGINEVVGRLDSTSSPYKGGWSRLSKPMVVFSPGRATLMGTINLGGLKFVISFETEPRINEPNAVNLRLTSVKIGAVSVTLFARRLARRMYREQIAAAEKDTQDIGGLIIRMVLNDEPAESVFDIEDKEVRVEKITVAEGKMTIRLVPVKK
jgi:hypothetical protein